MLLDRTIAQLDIGPVSPGRAKALGTLGYLQWLGALPGAVEYRRAAMRAHSRAQPFIASSPAVAVFCELLVASTRTPLKPLDIVLPQRIRRGGAAARRASL